MAKVCPKCHASQPDGVEFCPTDGSRLQTPSPPVAKPQSSAHPPLPADGDRHFPATLMGVGGDQAQRLAAGLQAQDRSEPEDATLAFDVSAFQRPHPAPKPVDLSLPLPPAKTIPPIQRPGSVSVKPVPAPVRPASVVVGPSSAAAPPAAPHSPVSPVATTLAKLIETSGALPTNLAVGRVSDVAELLARGRPATPITPAHIGYGDTTGSGKPRWADRGLLDPGYVAQYLPADLQQGPTPATDVYILGCILFEALTGKAPFRGKTVEEIARKQAIAAAPAVRQIKVDCDLPPALEIELQRALKKRPGDRHASPATFAEAIRNAVREDDRSTTALDVSEAAYLQQLLQGGQAPAQQLNAAARPPAAAVAPVKAIVAPTPVATPAIVGADAPAPGGKRMGLIAGLVVAGVVVIGGGAYVALHGETAPVAPPAPAVRVPEPPPEQPDAKQEQDVPPAPDVQPDVQPDAPAAPEVQAETDKPKVKPLIHRPDVKPPEVKVVPKVEVKQPDKKPDVNRPPVF